VASFAQRAKAEKFYNEGNVNARLGMFEVALSMYDQAISLDRSNPMYFNNRAATLKRLGRLQDAIDQYEQITREFPDYGKAFLSIGSTSIEIGNYQSAVSAYQQFYSAFKNGKFTFNPILGGVSQAVEGDDLLQTALLTSINYLSPQQQNLAIQAFREAINE
jgi:tetratricopeptide (TPR) repeat protein